MATIYCELVVEILKKLINEGDDLYCSTDSSKENERGLYCDSLGGLVSNEKEPSADLKVFSSNRGLEFQACRKYDKGMVLFELNKRLQILEEEGEVMREAFFRSVEERKRLMNEICQQFQIIHHFFCLQNQETGKRTQYGGLAIDRHKEGRMGSGLSQVLVQDSNPALVTRGLTANTSAFQ